MAIIKKQPTKRELVARKTKAKLFDTAIALFSEHGFDKVTIDDITQQAGVSKGNFYTHFESKESVLVEQFRRIDEYYVQVFEASDKNLTALEQLYLFFDTMVDYCANQCGITVMKIVYSNQISLGEHKHILVGTGRQIYIILRRITQLGLASGEFQSSLDEETLLEFLVSNARGLIYNWCLFNGELDLKAMMHIQLNVIREWLVEYPKKQS